MPLAVSGSNIIFQEVGYFETTISSSFLNAFRELQ
jgi:hypothetical protein